MAEEEVFKVVIAEPALRRYKGVVLPYLAEFFSYNRALEINTNIIQRTKTLAKNPARGKKEKYLEELTENFRFILHKETRYFEIKIIYYINEQRKTVYVTDFFPTRMDPHKLLFNK